MPHIYNCRQGDEEWIGLRCGMLTASELGKFLKEDGTLRTGDMPHSYLCRKAAEIIRGKVEMGFTSFVTEQGSILEESAIPWYELEFDCEVRRVGFVESDGPMFGCSPDGLIGDDEGLEIKSPQPTNHVKYLLGGTVPNDYWLQVQGSLLATGRKRWHFVSYNASWAHERGLPNLVVTVERDEQIMATLAASISTFAAKLTAAVEQIKALE